MTHRIPVTAYGISVMVRPERKLVRNSPSRRMGSVCISPTLRVLCRYPHTAMAQRAAYTRLMTGTALTAL